MEEKSQAVVEKKPQEKFVPPAGAMGKIYCNRFGKIFSNISIVAAALCLAILLSSLMTGMLVIVAFLVMVLAIPFTLGLILVAVPNYFSIFQSTANIMDKIMYVIVAFPYMAGISVGAAVLSIIFMCIDRKNIPWGRLVFSIIASVIGLAALILILVGGIKL